MKSLWIKIKSQYLHPKITPTVIIVQMFVLAHAAYLFLKGTREISEGILFMTYVVASASYWKRYARQKREAPKDMAKNNHSH